jgi:hypothetical protein
MIDSKDPYAKYLEEARSKRLEKAFNKERPSPPQYLLPTMPDNLRAQIPNKLKQVSKDHMMSYLIGETLLIAGVIAGIAGIFVGLFFGSFALYMAMLVIFIILVYTRKYEKLNTDRSVIVYHNDEFANLGKSGSFLKPFSWGYRYEERDLHPDKLVDIPIIFSTYEAYNVEAMMHIFWEPDEDNLEPFLKAPDISNMVRAVAIKHIETWGQEKWWNDARKDPIPDPIPPAGVRLIPRTFSVTDRRVMDLQGRMRQLGSNDPDITNEELILRARTLEELGYIENRLLNRDNISNEYREQIGILINDQRDRLKRGRR